MRFYLGTHHAHWLRDSTRPLFVSRRRLVDRKTLPEASAPWVLDSGGFTELSLHGEWSFTMEEYVAFVGRCIDEIGLLEWCAPMDWMCEPTVRQRTGLSTTEHQARTTFNYLRLRDAGLPVIPVLQGWTLDDYLRHVDAYADAGVDAEPLWGVGSVCRRAATGEVCRILRRLHDEGLALHAFGVRGDALFYLNDVLASADSMAWSFRARRDNPLRGCTHRSCANCRRYAERWYDLTLARLGQLVLEEA